MLPRNELLLKSVCALAGAILLYQAGHAVLRGNPLAKVNIPQLPTLTNSPTASPTNAVTSAAGPAAAKSANRTNIVASPGSVVSASTNPASTNKTNLIGSPGSGPSTNATTSASNPALGATNIIAANLTNTAEVGTTMAAARKRLASSVKPAPATGKKPTNLSPEDIPAQTKVAGQTNQLLGALGKKTNIDPAATNLAGPNTNKARTNITLTGGAPGGMVMGIPGMGMPGMGPGGPRTPPPPLPKDIEARIARVTDSELLAPVMRPMPMALLGIGGNDVFLRAPNGQTGLIKEGDSLGGVKLLKVGINRVLVEEDGQKKELTIFNGMGGESLLSTVKTNL